MALNIHKCYNRQALFDILYFLSDFIIYRKSKDIQLDFLDSD